MNHFVSRISQVALTTLALVLGGATAALAGPAPIEPEAPPAPVEQADGFPWLVTSVVALLAVTAVVLAVALYRRGHTAQHRLVTP